MIEAWVTRNGVRVRVEASTPAITRPAPPVATWGELHCYVPTGDARDAAWLASFSIRVRGASCACRKEWHEWLAAHPAPAAPADWFAWTVEAHNAVNVRLGKPLVTVDEARAIWKVDILEVP